MRTILVLLTCSLLGIGCGCPTEVGLATNRTLTGDLQYQIGDAVYTQPGTTLGRIPIEFSRGADGNFPPGDLEFIFSVGDPARAEATAAFYMWVKVHRVPFGASEIDLDDARTTLTGHVGTSDIPYGSVTGHVSVEQLERACDTTCPLRARGTVSLSATGPNGETFAFTSGRFSAADETYDTGRCIPNNS